jgi:hypothetical protein
MNHGEITYEEIIERFGEPIYRYNPPEGQNNKIGVWFSDLVPYEIIVCSTDRIDNTWSRNPGIIVFAKYYEKRIYWEPHTGERDLIKHLLSGLEKERKNETQDNKRI